MTTKISHEPAVREAPHYPPRSVEVEVDAVRRGARGAASFLRDGTEGEAAVFVKSDLSDILGEKVETPQSFRKSVKRFQRAMGIRMDGIVGPETMRALDLYRGRETLSIDEYREAISRSWAVPRFVSLDLLRDRSTIQREIVQARLGEREEEDDVARLTVLSRRMSGSYGEKLQKIGAYLRVPPEWIEAAILFESRGNPQAQSRTSSATGLIQFTERTARSLGTTTEKLLAMNADEQLDVVFRYLVREEEARGRFRSPEDLYLGIFYPAARGRAAEEAVLLHGTRAYSANRGLDKDRDGVITVEEATRRMAAIAAELEKTTTVG